MKTLLFTVALLLSAQAFSWEGYDYETNSYVEVEKGNLVRRGQEIEVYDYGSNQYQHYEVESVRSYGNHVELEVYDYSSGEYRTFEMDRE